MPYAMVIEQAGVTMEDYERVTQAMGPEPVAGLLMNAVGTSDGGLRFVSIWASREDARRFEQERLFPAFAQALAGPPARPAVTDFDVEALVTAG